MKLRKVLGKARKYKKTAGTILKKVFPFGFVTAAYVNFLIRSYNEGKISERLVPLAKISACLLWALEMLGETLLIIVLIVIVFRFLIVN